MLKHTVQNDCEFSFPQLAVLQFSLRNKLMRY